MSAAKRKGTKRVPSRGNLAGTTASKTGSVNRGLAAKARRQLMARTEDLYAAEQARMHTAVAVFAVSAGQADRLRAASAAVEAAR